MFHIIYKANKLNDLKFYPAAIFDVQLQKTDVWGLISRFCPTRVTRDIMNQHSLHSSLHSVCEDHIKNHVSPKRSLTDQTCTSQSEAEHASTAAASSL